MFVLITVGGYWFGASHLQPPAQNGSLYVPARHPDFGNVWLQKDFQCTIPITNRSHNEIEILRFQSSCERGSTAPNSVIVPAGETVDVQVTFDLTRGTFYSTHGSSAPIPSRSFAAQLAAGTAAGIATEHVWEIRNTVRTPFVLSESYVDFEDRLIVGTNFPTKSLELHCAYPMMQVVASTSDSSLALATING